jgi:hypothetical protein
MGSVEANRKYAGRLLLLLLLIFLRSNDNNIPETNHISGVYNSNSVLVTRGKCM